MQTRSKPKAIDRWWLPFLWLMLTPLVTLPLNIALFESLGEGYTGDQVGLPDAPPGEVEGWCPEEDSFGNCIPNFGMTTYEYYKVAPIVVAFLLPGLVHLVPFMWHRSKTPRVRQAGLVAGLMGLARIGATLLVLLALAANMETSPRDGASYFQVERGFLSGQPYESFWVLSFLAWAACGAAWIAFGMMTSPSSPSPAARSDWRQFPASGNPVSGKRGW